MSSVFRKVKKLYGIGGANGMNSERGLFTYKNRLPFSSLSKLFKWPCDPMCNFSFALRILVVFVFVF